MNNTYFILRHGETPYQLKKEEIIYPWPEPSPILLTEKGKKQIEYAAKKLESKKIDLIFSSDIPRAKETAEIISKKIGIKPIFDSRIREIDQGIYKGKPTEEYEKDFSDRKQKFFNQPLNGESRQDCRRRMMSFLEEIDKKYKNKNILIISHGTPLYLLEGTVRGLKDEKLLEKNKDFSLEVGQFKKLGCK
jgi:broad specificity phosphatase PhoE